MLLPEHSVHEETFKDKARDSENVCGASGIVRDYGGCRLAHLHGAVPSYEETVHRSAGGDFGCDCCLSRILCRHFKDNRGGDVPVPDGRENREIPAADPDLSLIFERDYPVIEDPSCSASMKSCSFAQSLSQFAMPQYVV